MSNASPPPNSRAEVFATEETQRSRFSNIWYKWFVDLIDFVNSQARINGSFVPVWGGFGATPPTGTMYYQIVGDLVILNWVATTAGTSNANFLSILNLPINLRPANSSGIANGAMIPCTVLDNNIPSIGGARITAAGVINFGIGVASNEAGFTAAGNKGLMNGTVLVYGSK